MRKNKMRKIKFTFLVISIIMLLVNVGWGQLLNENFSYTSGTLLTANGWTAHSGAGTNSITVSNTSLISYTGYLSSGIGNQITLTGGATGEDVSKTFTAQTSGTVYASFLVNVTSAYTGGDYFFHLGATVIGSNFRGRIWVKRDASNNLAFGISQSTTTVNYTPLTYALNTTYLVVLKYSIVSGLVNDVAAIYINPTLNAVEPSSGWISNTDAAGTDLTEVGSVALRQGSASTTPGLKLDGIRISTTWSDIVGVVAPTAQANNISFPTVGQTSMNVGWTNGDGTKRIVIINTTNSFTNPTNGTDPSANTTYSGSGEQVVLNGSGSTVSVSGLTANTIYWFRVYEYNGTGTGTVFLTTSETGNPNSQTTSSAGTPTITITGSISDFGNITVNTTSSEKNYTVSGTNLTDDISIAPPSSFEISRVTGVGFSPEDPLVLTQSGGTVNSTTIYVRFKPTTVISYSGNITHTSTSANNPNVAVLGTGVSPSNPATFTATASSTSQINLSSTANTNGNDIVVVHNGNGTFSSPTDGGAPGNVGEAFAGGTIWYKGSAASLTNHTGLSAGQTVYYKAFSYDALNFYSAGSIANATTLKNAPTVQALNITFSNIGSTAMSINCTKGDGDKRIIVINTLNSFTDPIDGIDPTASSAYSGSGEQVIYNGILSSTSVTGLSPNTAYWFRIYECNNSGANVLFLNTPGTNNPNSQITNTTINPADIMITHLSADYLGASDEFVVLFNNTAYPIDLSGYELKYFSAAGGAGGAGYTFSTSTVILPKKHLLLSPNATITVGSLVSKARDLSFTSGMATAGGQLLLRETANTSNIIFAVAWGTISVYVAGTGMTSSAPWPEDGMISLTQSGTTYIYSGSFDYNFSNTAYSHTVSASISNIPNSNDVPLPVSLSILNSTITDKNNININWTTSFETNNSGFEVERKTVDGEFSKVGFVTGNGTKNTPTNYSFEDKKLNTGKYNYRLKQIDYNGNFEYFNLKSEVEIGVPKKFNISQNYPNPFNPVTKIDFDLPFDSKVSIRLYDITGREIKTLVNETKQAGYYTTEFNGSNISSGTYFYRIVAEGNGQKFVMTKKAVLIK
jgi:hypothetical protein